MEHLDYMTKVEFILAHRNNITLEEFEAIDPLKATTDFEGIKELVDRVHTSLVQRLDQDELGMTLSFDDEAGFFILTYVSRGKSIFQVKMTPQSFEKLSADMIRVIKNYNLKRLDDYQAKKALEDGKKEESSGSNEDRGTPSSGMVDGKTEDIRPEGSSVQSENPDQTHGGETQEIV